MASQPKNVQQPRSITGDLVIQPYYRAGMYAELQKFGYAEDLVQQIMIGEDIDDQEIDKTVQVYGLDLTVSEAKALHAIQLLLDRTNYKGNFPGETIQSTAYKWEGFIPKLSMTYSEYYEAYGLKKIGSQFQGRQLQESLQALKNLAATRTICYKRRRITGSGKFSKSVSDVIRVTKPLISFTEIFSDLDEEETEQIIAGQDLPQKRHTRLIIEVSPLLVDQIDTFFLQKPKAFYAEIEAILPGRRISRAVSLFIEWLLTNNKQIVKISRDNLAKKLRLDYLIKQRKTSQIEIRLQEAFQAAKELEYLLDYKEDALGLMEFILNPERCKRVQTKKTEVEEG